MLMSCAHAGAASNPAVKTVAKNKTLRGGPAALTKDSSDGRAARPFRLPDSRTRSLGQAVPAVRCGALRGRLAAPVPRVAQPRRPVAVEVRPRAVAPSRQDSGPPQMP